MKEGGGAGFAHWETSLGAHLISQEKGHMDEARSMSTVHESLNTLYHKFRGLATPLTHLCRVLFPLPLL